MKNLNYELHYFENPEYPIIFHYNNLKKDVNNINHHWHMNLELLFVTAGVIEVEIDGEIIFAVRGDVVVINSNSIHSIKSHSDEAFYYCLILDYSFCNKLGFDTVNTKYVNINSDDEIKNIYQLIINESRSQKCHYKKAIRALCHTMMILLERNQVEHRDDDNAVLYDSYSSNIGEIKSAIEYIHENYHTSFDLDTLSKHLAISKYHMCRIFKDVTGITINQYTNQVRMTKAHDLIVDHNLTVSETANATGFNSISYFTRSFKNYYGYPPSISKHHKKTTGPNLLAKQDYYLETEFESLVSKYL